MYGKVQKQRGRQSWHHFTSMNSYEKENVFCIISKEKKRNSWYEKQDDELSRGHD